LLNASVGMQRVIARLRPTQVRRSPTTVTIQRRTLSVPGAVRPARPTVSHRTLSLTRLRLTRPRLSSERTVSLTAVALVALAVALSNVSVAAAGPTGNTAGAGSAPRIALGGAVSGLENAPQGGISDQVDGLAGAGDLAAATSLPPDDRVTIDGPFSADGTLIKPTSVDTTVSDGKDLMRTYRVKSGDTLTGIAHHFGVSMMTLWWANHLSSKDALHIGQTILIPPVSGVVVTVTASDTLESLSAKYDVDPSEIIDANDLQDPNLVVGQTLTIPGARAAGIPVPKPAAPKPSTTTTTHPSSSSSRPPARYTGGRMLWPVAGGYISQYFHYGHYAIDIAAPYGTKVMAAASGTVIFAGWKNNGGGYQVWISHGSNLYTTYNHMSAITVGNGQSVSRGQQVGRIGMTGNATGPHLHFEVWIGPIWNGGTRVNPLNYL
jgi:murein DD-endopeptidase MepM/ murein hydrolase activator NlpD